MFFFAKYYFSSATAKFSMALLPAIIFTFVTVFVLKAVDVFEDVAGLGVCAKSKRLLSVCVGAAGAAQEAKVATNIATVKRSANIFFILILIDSFPKSEGFAIYGLQKRGEECVTF